jgi:hypothetical protein
MAIKSIHDFIKTFKASLPAPLNAFFYLTGVGSKRFVENIKERLGIRAKGRKVGRSGELYHLCEAQVPYNSDFTAESSELRAKNTYFWSDNP